MRVLVLAVPLLFAGCRNAEETNYVEQFRAHGVQTCIRGEGLMVPHWHVPPERIESTCRCIVAAYMEGKTRRTLQHLTVGDQLRARERCSNGAPFGAGPGEEMQMDDIANAAIREAERPDNANGGK